MNVDVAVEFPATQPPGYTWLDDEPAFDPAIHLRSELPAAPFGLTRDEAVARLRDAIVDVERAIDDMRRGPGDVEHDEADHDSTH